MDLLQVIIIPTNTASGGVGSVLGYWLIMLLGYLTGIKTFYKACRDYNNKSISDSEWSSIEYIYGGAKLRYLVEYRFLKKDSFAGFIGGAMYTKVGIIIFLVITFLIAIYFASWYFKF